MSTCDQSRLSVAVLLCVLCLWGVTAQDVSVDSLTLPTSCSNDTLTFNCQVNFDSFFIRWNHTAFEEIEFIGVGTVVRNTSTTSDGEVVANLTRTTFVSEGLYMLSSTLIIHPPLNSIDFNNTNIVCAGGDTSRVRSGDAPISLYGAPSPPDDLSNETADDLSSVKINWNCPLYRGGGIVNYVIKIQLTTGVYMYVEKETGNCPMGSSHTIRAGGISKVKFNTIYDVEVTAISVCGSESEQSNITVMINAKPPQPFLNVSLMCSVGSVRADLQWQYGNSSTVYIPSTDNATIYINPKNTPNTDCDDVTESTMNCSFNTTSNTTYTVVLSATNLIGTNSTTVTFDSSTLFVNDSGLTESPPYITVIANALCKGDNNVTVRFGLQINGSMDCELQGENITKANGGRFDVPPNIILASQQQQQEYCYNAVLINSEGIIAEVNGSGGNGRNRLGDDIIYHVVPGIGLYMSYVIIVSIIAVHFYWFLPVIRAGLSRTNVLLYLFGFIFSVVVFPIVLVLWMLSCCRVFSEESGDSSCTCYNSPHNSTMTMILRCIGVVTSIVIFPCGIIVLILYFCGHKCSAEGLLRSFGIVGAVIVFPIGLVLLLASCFCKTDTESCKVSETEISSSKDLPKSTECRWTRTVVIIGIVGSAIVFPVGIVILIYYLCSRRPDKEKDEQELRTLRSGSPDPDSSLPKDSGPMYQDPSTIQHKPHPETGEVYTVVQPGTKKNKKKEEAANSGPPGMYQDPKTIEHEQAEGGDLYAMPQKDKKKIKKKGKEEEEEVAQMYSVVDKTQKQKSAGLTYAAIEFQASTKQPPSTEPGQYADIKY